MEHGTVVEQSAEVSGTVILSANFSETDNEEELHTRPCAQDSSDQPSADPSMRRDPCEPEPQNVGETYASLAMPSPAATTNSRAPPFQERSPAFHVGQANRRWRKIYRTSSDDSETDSGDPPHGGHPGPNMNSTTSQKRRIKFNDNTEKLFPVKDDIEELFAKIRYDSPLNPETFRKPENWQQPAHHGNVYRWEPAWRTMLTALQDAADQALADSEEWGEPLGPHCLGWPVLIMEDGTSEYFPPLCNHDPESHPEWMTKVGIRPRLPQRALTVEDTQKLLSDDSVRKIVIHFPRRERRADRIREQVWNAYTNRRHLLGDGPLLSSSRKKSAEHQLPSGPSPVGGTGGSCSTTPTHDLDRPAAPADDVRGHLVRDGRWVLDTGASQHMVAEGKVDSAYMYPASKPYKLSTANGKIEANWRYYAHVPT